jgi:cytochrome c oxidase cbb3-type subunit III
LKIINPEGAEIRKQFLVFWLSNFLLLLCCLSFAASCKREKRQFQVAASSAKPAQGVTVSDLAPGPHQTPPHVKNRYEANSYALSQGQQLFQAYNCVGCHAHGGGGMGPALIDSKWLYGSKPEQVYASIVEGRPNGMPSFRGRIPDFQVWQLVGYVRSMSGQVPPTVAGGRDDHMKSAPPPNSAPYESPKISTVPQPP